MILGNCQTGHLHI